MEQKEVKFSLVFRDMWQSAGKYVPRVDQLVKVAPAIIEMGCFARRLEQTIRREPPYWFWSHKRWKLKREVLNK